VTLIENAGIPRFRVHDCRHTAETHLLQRGHTERALKEVLGRSSNLGCRRDRTKRCAIEVRPTRDNDTEPPT